MINNFQNNGFHRDRGFGSQDFRNSLVTYSVLAIAAMILMAWCGLLAGGNFDPLGCPPGSTQISGWSNGTYTSLCVQQR